MKNERLNVIVSSETDASKRAYVLNISRKLIAALACVLVLVVMTIAVLAVKSAIDTASLANQLESLQRQER